MNRSTERWTGYALALPVLLAAAFAFGVCWVLERFFSIDTRLKP